MGGVQQTNGESARSGPGTLDFLVIEDDLRLSRRVVRALEPHGVVTASPCLDVAVKIWRQAPPPLGVVVDESLPDGSGTELLLEVRRAGWQGVGLVTTGSRSAEVQSRAHRSGAFLLIKPYALAELEVFAQRATSHGSRVQRAFAVVSERAGLARGERAVLELTLQGVPRADLPARLAVSESTVKTTVKRLLRKLPGSAGSLQGATSLVQELAGARSFAEAARRSRSLAGLLARPGSDGGQITTAASCQSSESDDRQADTRPVT